MSPIPSLNKVYSLLLQEESQRGLSQSTSSSSAQFESAACLAKQNPAKEKKRPTCDHCGFPGHTVDKCFQLIGYPPNWKGPKGQRKNSDAAKSKANSAVNEDSTPATNSVAVYDLFSPDMLQQFLAFAKNQSAKSAPAAAVALRQPNLPNFEGPSIQSADWLC